MTKHHVCDNPDCSATVDALHIQVLPEITVGMQVVVRTPEENLMGTVITTKCPTFSEVQGMHILIEGDRLGQEICYPAEWVISYAAVYAEV